MVTERQKRNWAKKQFERVDDRGKVVEVAVQPDQIEILSAPAKHQFHEPVIVEEDDGLPKENIAKTNRMLVKQDGDSFKPTRRQLQAKLRFHKYAPTGLILHLFESEPLSIVYFRGAEVYLIEYIGQIKEEEFEKWLDIPGFWAWFITDDSTDADIYHAKKAATDYLLSIMELDDRKEDGELDMNIVRMKVGVANNILRQNTTVKVEKKTINLNTGMGGLPKQFKNMDTNALELRIKQLKEHQ